MLIGARGNWAVYLSGWVLQAVEPSYFLPFNGKSAERSGVRGRRRNFARRWSGDSLRRSTARRGEESRGGRVRRAKIVREAEEVL